MLQKPQTKFAYARRIFALPVLFTVAFAYMVNAKNKEIAETNIQIEKAVSEIKRDTISPKNNVDQIVESQEAKLSKAGEKLKLQSDKLKTLSEKSKEKAAELKKIANEKGDKSYEFELKAKELKQLSVEMDKIVDRDKQFEIDLDQLMNTREKVLSQLGPNSKLEDVKLERVFPNGDNYRIKIHGNKEKSVDVNEFLYSKEFKEKSGMTDKEIRNLQEGIGQRLGKVNKFYINGKDLMANSDEVKKIANEYSIKGYNFNDLPSFLSKKELSKKELRKLEKLTKERSATEKKLQEIRKEQRELQDNPWIISVDAHATPGTKIIGTSSYIDFDQLDRKAVETAKGYHSDRIKNIIKTDLDDNVKIYINGKSSTRKDMSNLKPNDIASININKSKNDGKDAGEIHIKTKE